MGTLLGQLAVGIAFFLSLMLWNVPPAKRLFAAAAITLCFVSLFTILFTSLWIGNFIVMSLLYGVGPVWHKQIQMLPERQFVRMSNGDEYHGLLYFLWVMFLFAVLCTNGWIVLTVMRFLTARVAWMKRAAAELKTIFQ